MIVLEAVGPIIFLSRDTRKLRNEGFLSPFHPRYPDILTNSAHPMRAQDLANVTSYREWQDEDYQLYVLPRMLESKKMAKSGCTKQKEADLEYIVAKRVEKMIRLLKLVEMQSCMLSLFSCIKSSMPMYKLDKMQGEQQSKGCRSLELAFCILWGGNCDCSICYSRFCFYPAGSKKALTGTEIAVIELKD
ncbi:unnamed protein product [Camellia sinensis]